jgi:hypothetical protein
MDPTQDSAVVQCICLGILSLRSVDNPAEPQNVPIRHRNRATLVPKLAVLSKDDIGAPLAIHVSFCR